MLTPVESLEQYDEIIRTYRAKSRSRRFTNLLRSPGEVRWFVSKGRLLYEAWDQTALFYFDEGAFYRLHFVGFPEGGAAVAPLEREICCDAFFYNRLDDQRRKRFEAYLASNGLTPEGTFEQLRYRYECSRDEAPDLIRRCHDAFARKGLTLAPARPGDQRQVEDLLLRGLGPYDFAPLSPEGWLEQTGAGNVLCARDGETIAAAYFYSQEAGRAVIHPRYRGQGLFEPLLLCLLAERRWTLGHVNQYDWVEVRNVRSIKGMDRIGRILTGKMKVRYRRRGLKG